MQWCINCICICISPSDLKFGCSTFDNSYLFCSFVRCSNSSHNLIKSNAEVGKVSYHHFQNNLITSRKIRKVFPTSRPAGEEKKNSPTQRVCQNDFAEQQEWNPTGFFPFLFFISVCFFCFFILLFFFLYICPAWSDSWRSGVRAGQRPQRANVL